MPIISRKTQKIFAQNATNNGQFGSAQLGTKVLSSDLATLQNLTAFTSGWNSATMSAKKLPTLEEMQALHYITTSQIAYLFQEGIAEYDSGTEYRINSLVKKSGTTEIYKSLTDANIGNALTDNTKWRLTLDLSNSNLSALAGLTGASNKLPYFTGAGAMAVRDLLATTTNQGISYLNNPITIANNALDLNNDIDFSAGNAPLDDGSGQVLLTSIIVKRLDASWVAGTNQGGLFSGTKANSTKYYLFAITNGTINDAGFDSSPTGANIPSGYKGSYRGMVKTDSSGNILAFKQTRNKFLLASQITEFSGTVASTYTNLTSTNVPLKSEIEAVVNLNFNVPSSETNGRSIKFKDLVSNQEKQVITTRNTSITSYATIPDVVIGLNSSGQFQYKSVDAATPATDSSTNGTFEIRLNGWIDNNIKL